MKFISEVITGSKMDCGEDCTYLGTLFPVSVDEGTR